ncbi:iron(III) transport system permease protein [Sinobacterium caligoides]|uniref:Iron(III) transport system permease protein n=1 Tax=Sinobacterium caligoides TaxID=933926 RepID=A0A3N2DGC9_9GAMM|nr:iron ABC transporter permease [Sinobacterium caligoides]ROR98853.1 iron(III) transport system permease protein [Sinobacterium caligoides]
MPPSAAVLERQRACRRNGLRRWCWRLIPLLAGFLVLLPVAVIISSWSDSQFVVWRHLYDTQLLELLANTLILLVGVGVGVTVLGVSLAWLATICDFPGRRYCEWALMLPLAIPTYVLAFVVLGQWDYMGPLQLLLRHWWPDFRVDVRNPLTVIAIMTGVLYPYVYMLARSAFVTQGSDVVEASRVLGLNVWQTFFRVSLPMARPAIVAGLSLSLMETLADFGAVSVFNFNTFTTAIYKSWFGLFNLQAAAQLASLLLLFVVMALLAERGARNNGRDEQGRRPQHHFRIKLQGARRYLAAAYCWSVVLFCFALPVLQLLLWAVQQYALEFDRRYWQLLQHTVLLGACSAVIVVTITLLMLFAQRGYGNRLTQGAITVAGMGYALPGSVLAVGVVLCFGYLDRQWLVPLQQWLGGGTAPVLMGGLVGLLLAYLVRFLAVALGPVQSSIERVRPSIPEAARSLGCSQWRLLFRIYLPMLRPGILTALLLVLVDVMKEMPATLLLRPFGWDTLAVRIFEMTAEGEWQRAAIPALTLVLVGLLPVVVVIRRAR